MEDKDMILVERLMELEGLVLLRNKRGEDVPDDLSSLIERKWNEVKSLMESDVAVAFAPAEPAEPGFYAIEDDEEEVMPEAPKVEDRPIKLAVGSRRPTFSINDRFLFIRELFGGDAKAFKQALNRLDTFGGYAAAEEYFVRDFGISPDDETGARFLEIISASFLPVGR